VSYLKQKDIQEKNNISKHNRLIKKKRVNSMMPFYLIICNICFFILYPLFLCLCQDCFIQFLILFINLEILLHKKLLA